MLDLPADYLATVQVILQQHVPDMSVWAFGSRVNGQAHAGSDLDLVVINSTQSEQPQANLSQLRQVFEDSDLPILVDVLDWASIPETFRRSIKQCYIVITDTKKSPQ